MKRHECPFEAEVLQAIDCRGEARIRPELEAHIAECGVCSDLAAVAAAFDEAREEALAAADLPDAGRVWHRAQMRARREAIRAAGRPITAAQVIAFGAAMGLIGATFGAASTTFQAALTWAGEHWTALDKIGWLSAVTGSMGIYGAFVAGLVAVLLLAPAAVWVALRRE